jgi:murein DD-endopeptidase MepM/ murein hydrolase activator NlpD
VAILVAPTDRAPRGPDRKVEWMKFLRRQSDQIRPDHDGGWRRVDPSRAVLMAGVGVCVVLAVVILTTGQAWHRGDDALARENVALRDRLAAMEIQVAELRASLDEVQTFQQQVAVAADLPPMQAGTLAAGVGGRTSVAELANLDPSRLELSVELDQLLRQARLQRDGLTAILDTLQTRAVARDAIPSICPVSGGLYTSSFGMRSDPFTGRQAFHRGADFSLPPGSPVCVTADGVVVRVERENGLGLVVAVEHGNGITTVYGHLESAQVEIGQSVKRGQIVAASGSSGRSTGPHLHYEVRVGGQAVNPLGYILDEFARR